MGVPPARADGLRAFAFAFPGFRGGGGLSGAMILAQPRGQDTMVNAIPLRRPAVPPPPLPLPRRPGRMPRIFILRIGEQP